MLSTLHQSHYSMCTYYKGARPGDEAGLNGWLAKFYHEDVCFQQLIYITRVLLSSRLQAAKKLS